MSAGYVYVLENDSIKGMVKIGSTSYCAEKRAKELSSSSSRPTPFRVVYQEYVNDPVDFEKCIHGILDKYRVSKKREFFIITAKEVIDLIIKLKNDKKYLFNFHHYTNLLPELREKYRNNLKENLVFCFLHQLPDIIYVEQGFCKNCDNSGWTIESDVNYLDYIMDDNDIEFFRLKDDIHINCQKFINLEPISLAMCSDIFSEKYVQTIL